MFSNKGSVRDKPGIQRLDQVGDYLVIANKWRYEQGITRKFALVKENVEGVHSVHGSHRSAVVFAQKRLS